MIIVYPISLMNYLHNIILFSNIIDYGLPYYLHSLFFSIPLAYITIIYIYKLIGYLMPLSSAPLPPMRLSKNLMISIGQHRDII